MARSFNGISDVGALAIDLSPYAIISISAWVNWTTFASDDHLMFEYPLPSSSSANGGLIIDPDESSTGAFVFGTRNGGAACLDRFARPSAGVFHHYGFVLNRTVPSNKAYLDGAPQSLTAVSRSLAGGTAFANSTLSVMCRGGPPPSLFAAGSVADIAIWGLELTASEFSGLAKGIRPYNINRTLIFCSSMDGLVSPEPDLSGNKRNVTLTGTAYANGPPITLFTPKSPILFPFPAAPPSILFGQNIAAHYNWQIAPMEY